jgi:2-oxoglutarate dehydrogenase E1 component
MSSWGDITGLNRGYVLELYEKFRRDPSSVDADTRELFTRWAPPPEADVERSPAAPRRDVPLQVTEPALLQKVVGAVNLAQSIRRYGHLAAKLDPLGVRPPSGDPSLLPEWHGVTEEDLGRLPAALIRSPLAEGAAHVADVVDAFRRVYCSRTGYDYAHVFVPEERRWLRNAAESGQFRSPNDPINPVALLTRLCQVEAFERFLHRTFPGKTRFSIEGTDMLVPILDEVIGEAAEAGTRHAST